MNTAYIECFSGADCEIFLGAWFDLGLSLDVWKRYMAKLDIKGDDITVERVKLKGIAATKVTINTRHIPRSLHLSDIEQIIDHCEFPIIVKEKSKQIFHHWAIAEATVSETLPENICFHLTDTSDSLEKIVGNVLAWHLLGEPACFITNIQVGGGFVPCADGFKPVPTPATTHLLLGYPIFSSGVWGETISPAAAALIRTLALPAPQETFIGQKIGYGAGHRDLPIANLLRIQLGRWYSESPTGESVDREEDAAKRTVVIETNIDDMNPEWAGHLVERLLSMGAMDAYWIPVVMKKGRPGLQLRVACSAERQMALQEEIVRQTTTIGMRYYEVGKWSVPHKIVYVSTVYGEMPVKLAYLGSEVVNVAPEYEFCRQSAERLGIPVKLVYQTVLAEAIKEYRLPLKSNR
ncbi:TIGR00299 family protein [Collibacillus ludicampi]|uniref:TIGR00299 family protein n=1 Tax=Collibacillus ludicampi TaxID=2771369 RepID=A0AAV4LCM3_9BACL|nr:nickel pincer cofactor biosynthesis protein LarC [Collibacillus ludicampi]GIM45403.1 TIGR00299 family protein [Collibacillus ludicampi]